MPQSSLDQFCFRFQNGRWEHEKSVASKQNLKGMQAGCRAHCLPCEHWSRNLGNRNLRRDNKYLKQLISEFSLISHKILTITNI